MSDKKKELKLFEYVSYYAPADGKDAKVIKQGVMLETDERTVLIKVAREVPEEYIDRLDDVKVIIRPF